jgi:PA14 domain
MFRVLVIAAGIYAARAQTPELPKAPITTFGVTVVDSVGLRGDVYLLPENTDALPRFQKLKPVGSIYTTSLNIPPRPFRDGFPGVTDRFEWFAIDYNGNFWIEQAGKYRFLLASDDGSKLYIDNKRLIDNDGLHAIQTEVGEINLKAGSHRIRISYFQGPRDQVALVLGIRRPGEEEWHIFNTREFLPPRKPEN